MICKNSPAPTKKKEIPVFLSGRDINVINPTRDIERIKSELGINPDIILKHWLGMTYCFYKDGEKYKCASGLPAFDASGNRMSKTIEEVENILIVTKSIDTLPFSFENKYELKILGQ